ncbi:hypothetical protein SeGA_3266, partial [Salmonella enterica subsp. enterica serovar Gaminara str. A4-567]
MSDTPSSRRAATAVNRDAARGHFLNVQKSLTAGKAAAPAVKNARIGAILKE